MPYPGLPPTEVLQDLQAVPQTASTAPIDYFSGLDKMTYAGTVRPRIDAFQPYAAGGLQFPNQVAPLPEGLQFPNQVPPPPTGRLPANTLDAFLGELNARQMLDAKYGSWEDLLRPPEQNPMMPGQRSLVVGGRTPEPGPAPQYTHSIDDQGMVRSIPSGKEPADLSVLNPPVTAFPPETIKALESAKNQEFYLQRQARAEQEREQYRQERARQAELAQIRRRKEAEIGKQLFLNPEDRNKKLEILYAWLKKQGYQSIELQDPTLDQMMDEVRGSQGMSQE
jgi:hypothetical protein